LRLSIVAHHLKSKHVGANLWIFAGAFDSRPPIEFDTESLERGTVVIDFVRSSMEISCALARSKIHRRFARSPASGAGPPAA
jgi:hypothetical protein